MSVAAQPSSALPDAEPAGPGLCTALISRRFARRVTQVYDEALTVHGLTIGQFGILASLRRKEPIGIATLAERLSSDASTLSRLLKPLAAAGLISVDPDPNDRRAKALRLTDAGRARVQAAVPAWSAAHATIRERLGPERLAALRYILNDAFHHL